MCSQICQSVHLISCQYFGLYGSTEYALEKKSSDRKHYQTTIYYSNSCSMERLVCSGNTVIGSDCVSTLSHTHMQFRAARSRCTNFSLARYSIPFAICRHIGSSLRCAVLICRKIFMYHRTAYMSIMSLIILWTGNSSCFKTLLASTQSCAYRNDVIMISWWY